MSMKSIITNYLEAIGITINGNAPYDIHIHDEEFYNRIRANPSLGAGESYADGLWDCNKLDELFFRIFRYHVDAKLTGNFFKFLQTVFNHVLNLQTKLRSKKVADVHYNLGNDLFTAMLGKSMAYSCGYWNGADNLDEAQFNKFDLICRKIDLKQGDHVLDIGCGWGSLAKYMAQSYGCKVTAITISNEQLDYARASCKGLPIDFYLCDYREQQQYAPNNKRFDKITSVGMFEHVGYKNYADFMKIASQNLKADGLFLLHTIGKNNSDFYFDPWANKYIFPNAMLPSIKLIAESIEGKFVLEDLHNFGNDYDKTLMAWHANFLQHWPKLQAKYGDKFYRIWNYYLLFSAGAFRARDLELWQIVLSPNGVLGGYNSIRSSSNLKTTSQNTKIIQDIKTETFSRGL